ncbi:thiol peroxidase [Thiomicrospira microaerophila]|uniref:thiol peroxidase n=1 Tax=Thiomicrospira microaerophila TaxID=406020 RepID=UPI0020108BEB|nr:thiol peroxidase [Thiomicrospira microaerophila]UQB42147.1 thiol peroxidase [Thiomicrospira microaerophila]
MAQITLKGTPIETVGELPAVGTPAPEAELTQGDLNDTSLADFKGSRLVLNVFPSIDTGVCAASVREFNRQAASLNNTKVLCISADLPFAQARFCGAEGIDNLVMLSSFRHDVFGSAFGLTIKTGPLRGLLSRAVIVLDENGKIIYTEQVPEIAQEPNYQAAIAAL